MVIVLTNQVQILDKAVYISFCANAHGKDMHPSVLPLAIGKLVVQTGFLNLDMATGLQEENSEFQPTLLFKNWLCHILLVVE